IPLDPAAAQLAAQAGGKLTLGIRPEFVELAAPGTPNTVAGAVERVEDLGNYKIVSARLGDQVIMAKVGEDDQVAPGAVHLRFPPRWTRLYADDRALTGSGG